MSTVPVYTVTVKTEKGGETIEGQFSKVDIACEFAHFLMQRALESNQATPNIKVMAKGQMIANYWPK